MKFTCIFKTKLQHTSVMLSMNRKCTNNGKVPNDQIKGDKEGLAIYEYYM